MTRSWNRQEHKKARDSEKPEREARIWGTHGNALGKGWTGTRKKRVKKTKREAGIQGTHNNGRREAGMDKGTRNSAETEKTE